MILPSVYSTFGRDDAIHLVNLIGREDPETMESARSRLDEDGIDALLDDPRVLNALLTDARVTASPPLIFYVLVRQALLEGGIESRALADYTTTLVIHFGQARRAYRLAQEAGDEFHYLTDIVLHLEGADGRQTLMLNAHLGNFALWMTGLFPQYVAARRTRRGAPGLRYYEEMGTTGFRMAADSSEASRLGVDDIFRDVADHFRGVRVALNRISDRHLWRSAGDPVERLLREMEQRVVDGEP
ncbi:MAG: hypothetical protein OEO23_17040 [Gemmatimonadota bacterium]|nr:hypothetical protein [Gemmatimonadota bacterium]